MVSRVGKKNASTKRTSGFKYKARTAEDVKKRAEQSGGRFDSPFKSGFDVFRPKNGESQVRILPASWEDHDHYGLDVWMHRWIGGDNSNYLCLSKMKNKPCPACVEAKAAKDAGEEDEAKALQAVKRTLVWLIDRDDENDPPQPQIWDMSWSQDRDIASLCHSKRTGKIKLLDHPDEGYDLIIKKKGSGLRTSYTFQIDQEESAISDDPAVQDGILEYITENPLPDVLRYDTAEHIEKQLSGAQESKDEELDDDDETPKKKKKRVEAEEDEEDEAPRKRRRADPEEEEDDEPAPKKKRRADPEEEEDDEPAPKKKRRVVEEEEDDEPAPKKKRVVEEEEEDDEPAPKKKRRVVEEEEDDEPAPKKKRRVVEEEEEDDEPAPKKKRRVVEEEED